MKKFLSLFGYEKISKKYLIKMQYDESVVTGIARILNESDDWGSDELFAIVNKVSFVRPIITEVLS